MSNSDIRTFRAESMQDALDLVRKELGSDAVVLHTRQVSAGRRILWRKPKQEVEITAASKISAASRSKRRQRRPSAVPTAETQAPRVDAATVTESAASTGGVRLDAVFDEVPPRKLASNAILAERQATRGTQTTRLAATSHANVPAVARSAADDPLHHRLDAIQQMLEHLRTQSHTSAATDVPAELFALYTELIERDVHDELARGLMQRLKRSATPTQLKDRIAARALLAAMLEAELQCAPSIRPVPGKRQVVAMVGPTGVGKTTTIAKLTANLRLRDGAKVGLITVDTYRIAAVEQLRTYAEIVDVPLKVVTSPREMRRALDELAGLDLVLIDTGGRSPHDQLKMQELKGLLAEAHVDQTHLVLCLNTGLRNAQITAERFAALNPTAMVLTKLDEAAMLGTMLSICRHIALPVSYLTSGQEVPQDIESAHALRLTRLILGQEKLHS